MAICCNGTRLIPIRTNGEIIYLPYVWIRSEGTGTFYRWEGGSNYVGYTIAAGQFSVFPQVINWARAKPSGAWTEALVENMCTMLTRLTIGTGGISAAKEDGTGIITTHHCYYSNNILTPNLFSGQTSFVVDGYKMASSDSGIFRATLQSGNPWNRSAGAQFLIHAYYLILTTGTIGFPTNPLVCNVNSRYGNGAIGDNDCTLESAATTLNVNGINTLRVVKLTGIRAFLKSDNPYNPTSPYNRLQFNLQYVDMPRLKIQLYGGSSVHVLGMGMELWPYDYP